MEGGPAERRFLFSPFPQNVSACKKRARLSLPPQSLSRFLLPLDNQGRWRVPLGWLQFGEKHRRRRDRQTAGSGKKKRMKTKRIVEKQGSANSTPAGSGVRQNDWSRRETTTEKDVVIMVCNNPSWEKFIVMPCDARASVWLNDETKARKLALDFANETQGRVICRF